MPQYSKSKIYKLQCEDGYFYIGSTCNELRFRLANHKASSIERQNTRVYKHINELGWDKVRMVLVEEYCCENKEQLTRKEDEHIRIHKNDPFCLNTAYAFLTDEQRLEQQRKRYGANKEPKLQRQREYYEANKEKILQRQKAKRKSLTSS
jgi:predicted GIY-YIG superfamily endonuclease